MSINKSNDSVKSPTLKEKIKEKITSSVQKINPFGRESRAKKIEGIRAKNTLQSASNTLKESLQDQVNTIDDKPNYMPNHPSYWQSMESLRQETKNDLIATAVKDLYANWEYHPEDIVEVVMSLGDRQKEALKTYYATLPVQPLWVKKSKLWTIFAGVVDKVDDAAEKIGIGRYEQEEFDDMMRVTLDPDKTTSVSERRLVNNIKDLIDRKDYPKLVDILSGMSPTNMWNAWKIWAWALGALALISWWTLPMIVSWFFGVRWIRQDRIKKIAKDPQNNELLKGISTEINVRITNTDTKSWVKNRLLEIQKIYSV